MIKALYFADDTPNDLRFRLMLDADDKVVEEALKGGFYQAVATYDGDDPEDAWRIMQNGVVTPSWVLAPPAGFTPLVKPHVGSKDELYGWRSSCVGDIFLVNGKAMVCASFGFRPLTPALAALVPEKELQT